MKPSYETMIWLSTPGESKSAIRSRARGGRTRHLTDRTAPYIMVAIDRRKGVKLMARKKTAEHKQQMKMDRYNEGIDTGWMKYKACFFCGKDFVVNNYDDRKSRTPKFKGHNICPWCTPYSPLTGEVMHRTKYRTVMSVVLMHQVSQREEHEFDNCLECKARKLMKVGVE